MKSYLKTKNNLTIGFTLVELIVVITILSVLATVGFISFQWYTSSSRDSVRLTDVKSIEKLNWVYKTTQGVYPVPNDSQNITYSWAIAWTQWVFWNNSFVQNARMWSIPNDPITWKPYAYSVTNIKQEYELAVIFENPISNFKNIQTYATNQLAEVTIKWDYNGKILKVHTWSINYILWVPSILASDISSVDLLDIIWNQRLVYDGYNNLPASYSGAIYDNNWGFNFIPNELILFQWDINNLISDSNEKKSFLTNLQNNYSWSILSWNSEIINLLSIDPDSELEANNYVANILNNSIKTNIAITKTNSNWWVLPIYPETDTTLSLSSCSLINPWEYLFDTTNQKLWTVQYHLWINEWNFDKTNWSWVNNCTNYSPDDNYEYFPSIFRYDLAWDNKW